MAGDDTVDDGESEPGATTVPGIAIAGSEELVVEPVLVILRDADAMVRDHEHGARLGACVVLSQRDDDVSSVMGVLIAFETRLLTR